MYSGRRSTYIYIPHFFSASLQGYPRGNFKRIIIRGRIPTLPEGFILLFVDRKVGHSTYLDNFIAANHGRVSLISAHFRTDEGMYGQSPERVHESLYI